MIAIAPAPQARGLPAGSRWSSEERATPPVRNPIQKSILEGCQKFPAKFPPILQRLANLPARLLICKFVRPALAALSLRHGAFRPRQFRPQPFNPRCLRPFRAFLCLFVATRLSPINSSAIHEI